MCITAAAGGSLFFQSECFPARELAVLLCCFCCFGVLVLRIARTGIRCSWSKKSSGSWRIQRRKTRRRMEGTGTADAAMAGYGESGEILKPRTDNREYRCVVLPNALQALVISDPETDKVRRGGDVLWRFW
jgi:hypothetical protein